MRWRTFSYHLLVITPTMCVPRRLARHLPAHACIVPLRLRTSSDCGHPANEGRPGNTCTDSVKSLSSFSPFAAQSWCLSVPVSRPVVSVVSISQTSSSIPRGGQVFAEFNATRRARSVSDILQPPRPRLRIRLSSRRLRNMTHSPIPIRPTFVLPASAAILRYDRFVRCCATRTFNTASPLLHSIPPAYTTYSTSCAHTFRVIMSEQQVCLAIGCCR
ncbi:hypothetical protein BDW22DRAFT_29300 [Trametopsis cervina]|nr:hypothetical protein BDW22DRAFT_29300 [Trametopsis cervina]